MLWCSEGQWVDSVVLSMNSMILRFYCSVDGFYSSKKQRLYGSAILLFYDSIVLLCMFFCAGAKVGLSGFKTSIFYIHISISIAEHWRGQ